MRRLSRSAGRRQQEGFWYFLTFCNDDSKDSDPSVLCFSVTIGAQISPDKRLEMVLLGIILGHQRSILIGAVLELCRTHRMNLSVFRSVAVGKRVSGNVSTLGLGSRRASERAAASVRAPRHGKSK